MSQPIISVENLGKRYSIMHQRDGRYTALRDVIAKKAKGLFHRNGISASAIRHSQSSEDFWALRNVSFEVGAGEVLGIIGRNGAGKSTLLKILSRITEPTEGRVHLRGRVASLLEVGTGFHPELTGRENIYLNGAILGMGRTEIRAKFDEIVAFAEVEKFLDTPVKRYSSGMYVRLAFAVAAHLEPEILIVDEVLAVGDAEFQKKCLGKMESVARGEGRTVLFVSHNLAAVNNLCQRVLLLEAGAVAKLGEVADTLTAYVRGTPQNKKVARSLNRAAITGIRLDENGLAKGALTLEVEFSSPFEIRKPTVGLVLYSQVGAPIFGTNTLFNPPNEAFRNQRRGIAMVSIDPLPLWSGNYAISLWLSDEYDQLDHIEHAIVFDYLCSDPPTDLPPIQQIGPSRASAVWQFRGILA